MKLNEFKKQFVDLFVFEIAQEFSKVAPKDTTLLSRSFIASSENVKIAGEKATWFNLPNYWIYVEYAPLLRNKKANPNFGFIRRTFENKKEEIAKKVLANISKR